MVGDEIRGARAGEAGIISVLNLKRTPKGPLNEKLNIQMKNDRSVRLQALLEIHMFMNLYFGRNDSSISVLEVWDFSGNLKLIQTHLSEQKYNV